MERPESLQHRKCGPSGRRGTESQKIAYEEVWVAQLGKCPRAAEAGQEGTDNGGQKRKEFSHCSP